jgi:hypothetical protein
MAVPGAKAISTLDVAVVTSLVFIIITVAIFSQEGLQPKNCLRRGDALHPVQTGGTEQEEGVRKARG